MLAGLLAICLGIFLGCRPEASETISKFTESGRPARIQPDYSSTTIPANIAPLNFAIQEPGQSYCARIYSVQGEPIEVFSHTPTIQIPETSWHSLLESNKGQNLQIDIFTKNEANQWTRFQTITNKIASETIDGFLVYRKMYPTHLRIKGEVGIYCRNLTNFNESVLLSGMSFKNGCLNCHSFPQNQGNKMLLGMRSTEYGVGTLLVDGQSVTKVGTKFGYTSWHPSGKMAVYSVNNLPMFFHSSRNEVRDTVDLDSFLACYQDEKKDVVIEPNLAQKDRLENWPAWSADGKYLYFCSAPKLWSDDAIFPPIQYDQVKYDLLRVSYDIETNRWGTIETVLSAKILGKSVAMPHCSPDGRWLSFTLCDYGYFPAWQPDSDLYLLDLREAEETGQFHPKRLEINSDQSESWQSWSNNGRWLVFSSKRLQGVFTRLFISYIDPSGKAHKPILLPQKDPLFYESCLLTFNTPELIAEPPQVMGEALARVFRGSHELPVQMPITMATPTTGNTEQNSPWQSQRE